MKNTFSILCMLTFVELCFANLPDATWESSLGLAMGGGLEVVLEGDPAAGKTAIVLSNLNSGPVAGAGEARAQLINNGFRVVEIDYEFLPEVAFPNVCKDIRKIRSDILEGAFLPDLHLDQSRVFIIPEGYVIDENVLYYRDENRDLFLDICYPVLVGPSSSVPSILEFSCDNRDRMGNYSLVACRDTVLEGMAFAGFATAMADHPVAAPYKGLDAMPESGYKVKSAVGTLRERGRELGLSNEIGVFGFSRGSGMALLLAAERSEGTLWEGQDRSIQAAVVLSGRFTYLDLLETDHMLPRYEKAWGFFSDAPDVWRKHGALDYLDTPTLPLFLSINSGEGPDAQHQMRVLRERLSSLGSEYEYWEDGDGEGHKVPISPVILEGVRRYFDSQLR